MNVNKTIEESLKRHFPSPSSFLLAVSGGADSQSLLKAFPHVARKLGHSVAAHGVNHGLRPEAGSELDLAKELAEKSEVPFSVTKLSVERGGNLQARARDARYRALREASGPGVTIVTAHHADDRAETVLIRLLRGSGAGAMGVMPERSADLFRPLLSIRRSELESYCQRWGVRWANDPSNLDEKYLRVWVRKKLLPLMNERSPRIVDKLCQVADDLQAANGLTFDEEFEDVAET